MLTLIALVAGFVPAQADVSSPYEVDFNTAITGNTTSSTLNVVSSSTPVTVSAGWGHIVGEMEYSWTSSRYTAYQYLATGGVDDSGCLRVGNQFVQDLYGDDAFADNLLVTPAVNGTITLQAKRVGTSYSAYVRFYQVTGSGDDLTKGALLTATAEGTNSDGEISTGDWVTFTLNVAQNTRIGIKAEYVYIDNFTATSADFTAQPGLTVTAVTPNEAQTLPADADGNFTVSFDATVKNTGEVDLTTSSENYSLSLYKYVAGGSTNASDHVLVGTTAITEDLAQGATTTNPVTVTATLNTADYPAALTNGVSFRVYENVSGTFLSTKTVTVVPFVPELKVTTKVGNSTTTYSSGQEMYLGTSKETIEQEVTLTNTGGAPLVISNVTVPTGFTSDLTAQTIESQQAVTFTITLDATTTGEKAGAFVIASNAGDDFTLNLRGTIVPNDVFYVDFESDESVAGMSFEKYGSSYGWRSKYTNDFGYPGNTYSAYSTISSYGNQSSYRMTTPLLEVAEGDVLKVDVARYSSYAAQLAVYYSADRQNWTLVRTLTTDESAPEADQLSNESAPKYGKALKQFTISNIPAGQWYVSFVHGIPASSSSTSSYIYVDNILGFKAVDVARDVTIVSDDIAATGVVNSPFSASATVRNLLTEAVAAADYTARLYFGEEVQKEVASVELQGPAFDNNGITTASDAAFDFTFTPHAAGTFQAHIELEFTDGTKVATAPVAVTIADEAYSAMKKVGEGTTTQTSAPINYYYNKTQAEMIYTAEEMAAAGITAGTKIQKLVFRGYNTTKEITAPTKVWIYQTADDDYATYGSGSDVIIDVTTAEPVFDGDATLKMVGTSTAYEDLLTIDLPTPVVYQGGHFVVMTYFNGSTYAGSGLNFESTKTTGGDAKAIARRNDNAFEPTDGTPGWSRVTDGSYNNARPVILLGVEAEAPTISGKVTDDADAAMEGIEVKAQSGDVLYTGTTDENGSYTIAIKKDALDYTLTATKDGYFPFSQAVSVADGSKTVDIKLQEAKGLFIDEATIPATGMVNFAVTATAKATNYTAEDFAAGSYTAKLYVGDEAVAEAEAVEIKAGESADFTFTFTPHVEGTFAARIEFVEGENVAATDDADLVITEELVGGNVQVGEETTTSSNVPYYWAYADATDGDRTDFYYTPEMLAAYGITAGSKITAISFTGKVTAYSDKTLPNVDLKAWVALEAADAEFTAGGADLENMRAITVYDGQEMEFKAGESYTTTIDFGSEPLVYDGTSRIRIYQELNGHGQYTSMSYPIDGNYTGTSYYSSGHTGSSLYAVTGTPVAVFSVAAGKAVTGTVTAKADNAAVADATVSFKSGEVLYTGTTDAEGKFEIMVKQESLEYDAEIEAGDSYEILTQTIGELNEDGVYNFVLDTPKHLTGVITSARDESAVAGATVVLANDDYSFTATTDADGKYDITVNRLNQTYVLTVTAEGFVEATADVEVAAADVEQNVALETVAKLLYGAVTDENQAAVAGATVTVKSGETTFTATTDAEGKYEVLVDPTLVYEVTVTAEGFVEKTVTMEAPVAEDTELNIEIVSEAFAGITGVETDKTAKAKVYDLNGRLVGDSLKEVKQRGIYIVNGKKVAVK